MAIVGGGTVCVIGQQGRRGGGVSADHQLQAVRGLGDEWNHQTAVKVPGPDVVDLGEEKRLAELG